PKDIPQPPLAAGDQVLRHILGGSGGDRRRKLSCFVHGSQQSSSAATVTLLLESVNADEFSGPNPNLNLIPLLPLPTPMRVVLCYPLERRHYDQIVAACPPGTEVVDAGQERIAAELPNADIFCGHAKVPVPWPDVFCGGRLKWIQSSAAGLDHCLVPEVIASNIVVTSASGLFADQVAEQTLALLLGLLRGLPTFFRAAQKKEFIRRPTLDLHGSTVGI